MQSNDLIFFYIVDREVKMKVKGLVAVIIACVLTLCTVMPAFASSSFAVDQELRQHRTENCVQKMSLRGKIKT